MMVLRKLLILLVVVVIQLKIDKKEIAIYIGYPRVYGMLANSFWLNVTCFDIWIVFSGYSQPYLSLTKKQEMKKFLIYSAYAWAVPGILCIIRYNIARLLFISVYTTVSTTLQIVNLLLFLATVKKLYDHNKLTKNVLIDECTRNYNKKEKERFNLYLKLMLVMGIPWISDILELIFPSLDLLWQIMFTFNLFQGVMMFIIFICKKRILHAINVKLWPSKIIFTYNESSSKNSKATETSSSRGTQGQCTNKTDEKEVNEMTELDIELKSK
ncbi:G-protein coupled receptor Mth2-like isoform X2 [Lycorma delicatula]|uniref:G-protein coupled receptor Mth2-like isoform X2 n=1 Tax=Lycorma delicatula TaxID=130591 RepID=UPI003F50E564